MKKISLFITAVVLVVGLSVKNDFDFKDYASVKFYIEGHVETEGAVRCGNDTIVSVESCAAKEFSERTQGILAVTLTTDYSVIGLRQKYNVKVLREEQLGDSCIFYGYSPLLAAPKQRIGGVDINIQMVKKNEADMLIVGIPVILTDW